MTRKKVILTCIGCLFTLALYGQELTLQQALDSAKENNGTLKVATLELQQSLRNTEVNSYLPSLTLEAGVSATGSIIDKSYSTSYSVGGLSFSFDSASTATESEKKEINKQSANNTYQSSLNTVASNVTTAYWNTVACTLSLQSKQNTLSAAQESYATIQAKYEGGKASTLEVSQAELTVSDAQYDLQIAQQALDSAKETLQNLIGITGDWTFDDMPQIKEPQPLALLETSELNTSTAKKLKLAIDSAKLTAKSTSASYIFPSVNVSLSNQLGGNLYSSSNSRMGITDTSKVSVTVSVPLDYLISTSSAAVAIDDAKYAIEIAQQNYTNGISSLDSSVKEAQVTLNQTISNLDKLEKHLKLAEEQLRLTQESYNAGKSSYSELKDATNSVQSAQLSILQQKLNYTIALYDLSSLLETSVEKLVK